MQFGMLPTNHLTPQNPIFPAPPTGPMGLGGGPSLGTAGINADGSSGPSGANNTGFGLNGPTIPGTGPTGFSLGAGYTDAGGGGLARDMPTSIIEGVLRQAGMSPGGGLADLLYSMASPDQLNTLYGLLAAGQGGALNQDLNTQNNFNAGFYNNLMGQGAGLPSLSSVIGPAFGGSGGIDDPFGGMLTGGTFAQQVQQLLGAVSDVSKISMPGILASALMNQLTRAGHMYGESQAQGGNTTFLSWLQQRAPQLAHQLGG